MVSAVSILSNTSSREVASVPSLLLLAILADDDPHVSKVPVRKYFITMFL